MQSNTTIRNRGSTTTGVGSPQPTSPPSNKALKKAKQTDDYDSSKDESSSDDEQGATTTNNNSADNAKPTDPPESRYKKLAVRSVMGACMISFFAVVLSTDHAIVSLFVIALQLLVFKEMVSLRYIEAKEKKIPRFRTLAWYFLLSAFFFFYAKPILVSLATRWPDIFNHFVHFHMWHSFLLYCIGFVSFIVTLRKGVYRYQFSQFTWTLMTLMMVVVQSNFIIANIYMGLIWFILPVSIIVCNDIFAYLNGFFFGRKFIQRPLMKISPNKTWEGFIGATFWTIIFAYLFNSFLMQFKWVTCPKGDTGFMDTLDCPTDPVFVPKEYVLPVELSYILAKYVGLQLTSVTFIPMHLHAFVLALFGSLIAPFGGFFASGIKRAYKIKDFDSIIPGHGGITDRTDCQFIMGLFVYVYYLTFVKTSIVEIDQVWNALMMLPADQQVQILHKLSSTLQLATATA
ncbi:hypothetical protein SAMD00019534_079640 [Acytostelium subglobosum LB1]|uniref:hypothetical protein n=1 Tax=Acytostelium subglobosum LB1 TaxID=1410327 RepID=UPI00064522D6|nr:hypothetical protein SAMD00019534_079640 [Acytostelium subglobosum LB1]GAM24789.1 hypothetical protein SAMD00019534_079640 [Acytostelium subglobosum LB1]|eukprot:XP_012752458.1 hypothetical protein SAMD00019534_079640 [Acytostelium subglobosum LB1]